jgi:hypothetical protein
MEYLDKLSPEGRKLVLEQGELDGTTYLVTQRRLDFKNLLEWLERITPPAYRVAALAPQEPPPPQPERTPGEFTRMFAPSTPAAAAPSPSVDPGTQSKPTQPGSFTRAFQAISKAESPKQHLDIPVPTSRPGSTQPGEFTRMFQSPLPPARETFDPAPPIRKPDPTARPPFQQAGEFTRVFGQSFPPPASPPASPPPPLPPATDTAKPEPADEFRDLFGPTPEPPAEPAPPPAAAQAPSPAAAAQPKPSSNLPIILILIVLVLTAVVLIAYFVLRR